jgi:hypothetical protein
VIRSADRGIRGVATAGIHAFPLGCAGFQNPREGTVRNLFSFCGAVALLGAAASANATARLDPFVITIDQHSYTSFTWPIEISPLEHLVQAPEALMGNCRRGGGAPLSLGPQRLIYALEGNHIEAQTLSIEFHPTRVVMTTEFGDVECDGAALTGVTGVGRVFRDYFEG